MEVTNYLLGYKNLKIIQDTNMFNFSLDSVMLANFVTITTKTKNILDIGTGNAPIPLILSTKTNAKIIGVELQKETSILAQKSIEINNLQNQITIINKDINQLKDNLKINYFDIITCNPPFFKVKETSKLNNNDYKTIARHEIALNLNQICEISKRLLKNGGNLNIVHRPERIPDILETMKKNKIEPKRMRLIYPKQNKNANIVLIEGKKNGKPGLKILPPLISHQENGEYTKEIKKYFE